MSFVAATRGWRHVFWALLGICGGFWLILVVVLVLFKNATRHSVLLRRRAAKLRDERQTSNINVPEEMKRKSLAQLFRITLSRPFRFLATEAIMVFAALYNGYLYGLSFLFNGAFDLVFGSSGYGFGTIGVGLSLLGFIIGVSLGPVINIWQEHFYQKRIRRPVKPVTENAELLSNPANTNGTSSEDSCFHNIPEARLQFGKLAGVLFPISLSGFPGLQNPPTTSTGSSQSSLPLSLASGSTRSS